MHDRASCCAAGALGSCGGIWDVSNIFQRTKNIFQAKTQMFLIKTYSIMGKGREGKGRKNTSEFFLNLVGYQDIITKIIKAHALKHRHLWYPLMGTPRYVVLDEADEMLKKEFYEQIKCKTETRQHTQTETDRIGHTTWQRYQHGKRQQEHRHTFWRLMTRMEIH